MKTRNEIQAMIDQLCNDERYGIDETLGAKADALQWVLKEMDDEQLTA